MSDAEMYAELQRMFRFYIALTVGANLAYAILLVAGLTLVDKAEPWPSIWLLAPIGMVSTGFAAVAAIGVRDAASLHRATQLVGRRLELPHVTATIMLPIQSALTLIFHAALSLAIYGAVFLVTIGAV